MRKLLLPLILFALSLAPPAWAALAVDVTQGNAQPLPIAIPDFLSGDQNGANIAGVVRADLERSGLFKPIDPRPMSIISPTSMWSPISPIGG